LSCQPQSDVQAWARWIEMPHLTESRSRSDCSIARIERVWTIGSRSRLVKMGHLDPSHPCLFFFIFSFFLSFSIIHYSTSEIIKNICLLFQRRTKIHSAKQSSLYLNLFSVVIHRKTFRKASAFKPFTNTQGFLFFSDFCIEITQKKDSRFDRKEREQICSLANLVVHKRHWTQVFIFHLWLSFNKI